MKKGKVLPIIFTIIFIVIVISLFVNVKQTVVTCQSTGIDSLGVKYSDKIITTFDNNKIGDIDLLRNFVIPDKYPLDQYMDSIMKEIHRNFDYLGNNISIVRDNQKLTFKIHVMKKETIILKNVSFRDDGNFHIVINPNTKSSDVVTLRVGDSYSNFEYVSMMKANSYTCS